MTYKISREAANDLEKIWFYTYENWSIEQADRYINLIFNDIKLLTNYPNTGKDYSFIRKGYKSLKVKSHLIFYKINQKNNYIEIIRILHQRMDIDNHLND